MIRLSLFVSVCCVISWTVSLSSAVAQLEQLDAQVQEGTGVPSEVRTIYQRGIDYLVNTQRPDGSWNAAGSTGGGRCGGRLFHSLVESGTMAAVGA